MSAEPEGRPAPAVDAEALVAHARDTHVVVVGGGIAGLVAALECTKVGFAVTVLEASPALGGVVRAAEVAGIGIDAGAESYATRGGHVRALLDELGLAERVVAPAPGRAWVAGLPGGGAAPLPAGGILGIPANPFADDVRAVIGWSGAWRAYVDRLRPPLTIGHAHSLGKLVRSRMGARVVDRLVAPVTSGVYSAHPDDIDIDLAAPGLNTALTRTGSLSGAVGQLLEVRAASAGAAPAKAPGGAVEGIEGGMTTLVTALAARLGDYGVEIRSGIPVTGLEREGAGWRVHLADDGADAAEDAAGPVAADVVIVATTEESARTLLAPHVPELAETAAASAPRVEIVTLILDAPALDDAPRGTGVLTVPGSHTAKALTHATAKWPWLRRDAGGRHVVRVSFGSQGEAPATADLDDDAAAALALREASALLGVDLAGTLVGAHREGFVQAQPGSALGQAGAAAQAREAIGAVPGLAAVGAWLAGTGLAQVVPDATAEADRVRHAALWGGQD